MLGQEGVVGRQSRLGLCVRVYGMGNGSLPASAQLAIAFPS